MSENSVDDIVLEIKDKSELMVDLAYSSLLYDNTTIAKEVYDLEELIDELYQEIQKQTLEEVRKKDLSVNDALSILRLAECGEKISDAALEIADVELRDVELPDRAWWLDKTKEWQGKYKACLPKYYNEQGFVHPYVFMEVLSEELEPCDVVVTDCGGNAIVTCQVFEAKFGQRVCSSHGNSPMGYSFAGGIGACFIDSKRPIMRGYKPINRVVCVIGDGGFNMNIQELQTIKNYGLKLKTFILNNHSYGITRQFQETNFQSRYLASGPDGYNPPDFIKVVQAYGIETETIQIHAGMRGKIKYILNYPEAIVCDVDCGMFSKYEPRIFGWRTPIEDMFPYLPREEFRANMIIDPVDGWKCPAIPGKIEGAGLA